ncbi:hypothetical protein C1886_02905 [Pseudomonas sp. FW300-N1A1]|nr:hypothetical protein C1886_02905 [Pseudomonas sp. FW300-N1A1]
MGAGPHARGPPPWRGSVLPLGREAAQVRRLRSFRKTSMTFVGAASQPSGSKLPRHGERNHYLWAGSGFR